MNNTDISKEAMALTGLLVLRDYLMNISLEQNEGSIDTIYNDIIFMDVSSFNDSMHELEIYLRTKINLKMKEVMK